MISFPSDFSLFFDDQKVASIPINTLVENSPMYDRKWKKAKLPQKNEIKKEEFKKLKFKDVMKKILSNPNICSKEWIWQQYDHTVMGDTIQKPGGDSGVVRVNGTNKAIAATVDSSAVYCWAHPLSGGKQIVCESWRNLISVGATPIAITNCLNFGSPENEDNMGEFVECVQGIGEASEYLKFPVVSGNVSFYNQTKEVGIKPTPSIGGVGLIKDYTKMITMDFKELDNIVLLIGKTEGHIDQSLFARTILDEKNGPPPEINLFNEKNNGETMLQLINKKLIKSAHDVSLGGIITAISKMENDVPWSIREVSTKEFTLINGIRKLLKQLPEGIMIKWVEAHKSRMTTQEERLNDIADKLAKLQQCAILPTLFELPELQIAKIIRIRRIKQITKIAEIANFAKIQKIV